MYWDLITGLSGWLGNKVHSGLVFRDFVVRDRLRSTYFHSQKGFLDLHKSSFTLSTLARHLLILSLVADHLNSWAFTYNALDHFVVVHNALINWVILSLSCLHAYIRSALLRFSCVIIKYWLYSKLIERSFFKIFMWWCSRALNALIDWGKRYTKCDRLDI